jgi:hypothetical protein
VIANSESELEREEPVPQLQVQLVFRILTFSVAEPDPGSGAFLTPGSGIRIRDEQSGSYFLELRNHFFGLKKLKFFDAGSGMENIRVRDPG